MLQNIVGCLAIPNLRAGYSEHPSFYDNTDNMTFFIYSLISRFGCIILQYNTAPRGREVFV